MTQDNFDATLWRRFGTSRLARTVCAAPTGAANMALYGKMPSVTYEDYPEAALIILWGVNPSASGIHLVPYVREAQKRGAKLVVVDPRSTQLSRAADVHLPVKPGTDVAVALAIHRHLFTDRLRRRALSRSAHQRRRPICASAPRNGRSKGPRRSPAISAAQISSGFAELYATQFAGADPLRLGPRAESQRRQCRDGRAGAAGGRRQVRRPRRRLFDEQLRLVEHRAPVDRRRRARHAASST